MNIIKGTYNFFRLLLVTVITFFVLLYGGAFLLLSIPTVQNHIRGLGEKTLSDLLKTDVKIGYVDIEPFNRISLLNVQVPDQKGDSLLSVEQLGAGVSLYNLVAHRKLVFTYGEIIGLHGHVTQKDKNSPTNAQFLIDAFKPKDYNNKKQIEVTIYNLIIRKSELQYDLLSVAPHVGTFDKNHIHIYDLKADVVLPKIKRDDYAVTVKRMSLIEHSGLVVKHFASDVRITDMQLSVANLKIKLPASSIEPEDFTLRYSSLKNLSKEIYSMNINAALKNAVLNPADFRCFYPKLRDLNRRFAVNVSFDGTLDKTANFNVSIKPLDDNSVVSLKGNVANVYNPKNLHFSLADAKLHLTSAQIKNIVSLLPKKSATLERVSRDVGDVSWRGSLSGSTAALNLKGLLKTAIGDLNVDGHLKTFGKQKAFNGKLQTNGLDVGQIINKEKLINRVALNAIVAAKISNKLELIDIDGRIPFIELKGRRLSNIVAKVSGNQWHLNGNLRMADPNADFNLTGDVSLAGERSKYDLNMKVNSLNLEQLGLAKRNQCKDLAFDLTANILGNKADNMNGFIDVKNLDFKKNDAKALHINSIRLNASNLADMQQLDLQSDFVRAKIYGAYNFSRLVPTMKHLLAKSFPDYFGFVSMPEVKKGNKNKFDLVATLSPSSEFQKFLNLPVDIVYDVTLKGRVDEDNNLSEVTLTAPYLLKGNKLIENTRLKASIVNDSVKVAANTSYPGKKGLIDLSLSGDGNNNVFGTKLNWALKGSPNFHGDLSLSTLLGRKPNGEIDCKVVVNPTEMVFNDTVWNLQRSRIDIEPNLITVNDFVAKCDKQFITIDGVLSKNPDDLLSVELNDISLDYIFETLNIDNVAFGGRASGKFFGNSLLTSAPRLSTPDLHIDRFSYNGAVLGDADIVSRWNNEKMSVKLSANISQDNGLHSYVDGEIFTKADSLYMDFNTQKVNVAFMKPFMKAFTSDVGGEVSGHAVLYGNFHTINLYGDVFADSLRFKLDYTNVYYTCSDSVHIKPNLIKFDNIEISDRYKHHGYMSGWLKHDSFHNPVFNFSITGVKKLLCFDMPQGNGQNWYGTVFANGSAFVAGEPGSVKVNLNLETAPGSTFSFVLSDNAVANEYKFITFRDRDKLRDTVKIEVAEVDTVPDFIKKLKAQSNIQQNGEETLYSVDLQADITPNAAMNLIMDPQGGDKIKAYGNGHIRLTYNNSDDQFLMYGKYAIEKGNYNFTLQDVIIKDFIINQGSSVSFHGDPYAANLDIEAIYALNANLRDLDESFATDKELNRTNVPVHALLKAQGSIKHPDVSFDLEFPTLTSDAYRKIKSIISTEDMMNRQIIYLLALNRFYTPDYMNATTNNNELTSVASSTISSQLSNLLGQISDKWTISPNFHSQKGDFSDVDVDLALSSQLLNNRLLFNGNFGYRDNAYNSKNSNFIGDFDIEYLLNSRGNLRLKAYNHFNDQNYFIRNALTTQGVGIVFRHEFDKLFRKRQPKPKSQAGGDTIRQSTKKSSTVNR